MKTFTEHLQKIFLDQAKKEIDYDFLDEYNDWLSWQIPEQIVKWGEEFIKEVRSEKEDMPIDL